MKYISAIILAMSVTGCSTIDYVKKYWPRDHDPVMFDHLVAVDIAIKHVDCEKPDWSIAVVRSEQLAQYTQWRNDPQSENIDGLHSHTQRMSKGGSKVFCEIGKKTAGQRIEAAKSAWEKR